MKPKIGEACHLALEKENKILTDQSGSSIEECIRSDLVIDTNQQVHVFNDNYDEKDGPKNPRIDSIFGSRPKLTKNEESDMGLKGGLPKLAPKIERFYQEIGSDNLGPTTPPKLFFNGPKSKIISQNIPKLKENASGKKLKGHKGILTKKVSPKKENRTPELKRLFEKIRAKKENKEKEKDTAYEKIVRKKADKEERKLDISSEHIEVEKESDKLNLKDNKEKKSLIPQGEEKKVQQIIRKYEKKIEKKVEINSDQTTSIKKLDSLSRINSPTINKADSPNRRRKTNKFLAEKIVLGNIPDDAKFGKNSHKISHSNLISRRGQNVRNIQRTLEELWGPER